MADIQSQKVIDEPNENTIFMVWNFKDGMDVAPVFKRLCALVGNLNNSATNRFPQQKASVVLGISHGAWQRLDLPQPLPQQRGIPHFCWAALQDWLPELPDASA